MFNRNRFKKKTQQKSAIVFYVIEHPFIGQPVKQPLEDREHVGGGFASASRCAPANIAAKEGNWDCGRLMKDSQEVKKTRKIKQCVKHFPGDLDGSGVDVAQVFNGFEQGPEIRCFSFVLNTKRLNKCKRSYLERFIV